MAFSSTRSKSAKACSRCASSGWRTSPPLRPCADPGPRTGWAGSWRRPRDSSARWASLPRILWATDATPSLALPDRATSGTRARRWTARGTSPARMPRIIKLPARGAHGGASRLWSCRRSRPGARIRRTSIRFHAAPGAMMCFINGWGASASSERSRWKATSPTGSTGYADAPLQWARYRHFDISTGVSWASPFARIPGAGRSRKPTGLFRGCTEHDLGPLRGDGARHFEALVGGSMVARVDLDRHATRRRSGNGLGHGIRPRPMERPPACSGSAGDVSRAWAVQAWTVPTRAVAPGRAAAGNARVRDTEAGSACARPRSRSAHRPSDSAPSRARRPFP